MIPLCASWRPALLETSPSAAATSSTEKFLLALVDATRSINLRVVETPPNQRLMRQISRSDASASIGGQASESRISAVLMRCMAISVDDGILLVVKRK